RNGRRSSRNREKDKSGKDTNLKKAGSVCARCNPYRLLIDPDATVEMLTNDAERFPSGDDRKVAYRSGAKSPTEDRSPQSRSAGRRPERASRPRYLFLKPVLRA